MIEPLNYPYGSKLHSVNNINHPCGGKKPTVGKYKIEMQCVSIE